MTGRETPLGSAPDVDAEWCDDCQRWHQRRQRPVACKTPGCDRRTDRYHGTCEAHR